VDWIHTSGGPFILGDLESLKLWRGTRGYGVFQTRPVSPLRGLVEAGLAGTDYANICCPGKTPGVMWRVTDSIFVVPEPLDMALWRRPGGFSLFHGVTIDDDKSLEDATTSIVIANDIKLGSFQQISSRFCVFDSALSIESARLALDSLIEFDIEPGCYLTGFQGVRTNGGETVNLINFDIDHASI
jgi:hypothetical protein